ncbi:MAG: glycogen synthase GlgA [Phycisphaeraceae bacterium]|nr:glycogen synthase GlgA [Phycisphaeraceae bacterium]
MLRICFVASEFAPFAKTGGLADVTAGLSRYLVDLGQDVRVFLPFYRGMDLGGRTPQPVEFARNVGIELGGRKRVFTLETVQVGSTRQWVHLVNCPELFHRDGLYRSDGDEHIRFAFLCRAAIESCQRMGFGPDIFHVHDWHTALVPLYLKTIYAWDRLFAGSRTVLTLHNLAYQGWFAAQAADEIGFAEHRGMLHQDDLNSGTMSYLRHGIIWADWLTAVSRTYAREIQTEEFGMGLESMLRARADHLSGIVNGVDYHDWNPETDPHIARNFSRHDLSGKAACRRALLETMGLDVDESACIVAVVTRLTGQKGIDLMFETVPELLRSRRVRFVALGSGESRYEEFLHGLQKAFPRRAGYFRGYQNRLAHMIEAGADVFLMPSRFEPCGLNQMYSLRYGTVPVVRRTGGLADTIRQYDPATDSGTGFLFDHPTAQGLRWGMQQAVDLFERDRLAWTRLMQRGMAQDFSWERQGREYLSLYARLSGR